MHFVPGTYLGYCVGSCYLNFLLLHSICDWEQMVYAFPTSELDVGWLFSIQEFHAKLMKKTL